MMPRVFEHVFAILLGIAVAVVLFATFFPRPPPMRVVVSAGSFLSMGDIISAKPSAVALRRYQRALCEQLGRLARVKDEPKAAAACFTNAATGLVSGARDQSSEKLVRCGGGSA
jgi:hypothetical protein